MTVVEAAVMRIKNVFSNGVPVYMSLSGGKDSICMADLVYQLIRKGEIDPKQLTLVFIDEEAIYDCCIEAMMQWRKKFLMAGCPEFRWYCLPLKQVSCFNQLENSESWITWEPGKEDVSHTDEAEDMYGTITHNRARGTHLSVQRLQYMAMLNLGRKGITGNNIIFPIYDWKDKDVWLYIRDHHLDIPEAYLWIYQAGENRHSLRISNFFAADSLRGLKHVAETDPDLWARIEKREPNAYLVMLYWDTEWYKRRSKTRRQNEAGEKKDYKELTRQMLFENFDKHFTNPTTRRVAAQYRRLYIKTDGMARPRDYRKMHDALIAGDPKMRSLRAIFQDIFGAYAEYAKKFRTQGGEKK